MIRKIKLWIVSLLGLGDLISMLANVVIYEDRKKFVEYLKARIRVDNIVYKKALEAARVKITDENEAAAANCRFTWRFMLKNIERTKIFLERIEETFPKEDKNGVTPKY